LAHCHSQFPPSTGQQSYAIVANPGQLLPAYANLSNLLLTTYHSWTASVHPVTSIDYSTLTVNFRNPMNSRWNGGGLTGASGNRCVFHPICNVPFPGTPNH
jgi:hypothetical protein